MPSLAPARPPCRDLREDRAVDAARQGGLTLRPWRPGDAPAVVTAFRDPDIQQWHRRRADSEDEALTWSARWRADRETEARADGRWGTVHATRAVTNAPSNGICRSPGFTLLGERSTECAGRTLWANHRVVETAGQS